MSPVTQERAWTLTRALSAFAVLGAQWLGVQHLARTIGRYEGDWALRASPEHVLDLFVVPLGVLSLAAYGVGALWVAYRRSEGALRMWFASAAALALVGALVIALEVLLLAVQLTPYVPVNGHAS